jgi:hypothetical protein
MAFGEKKGKRNKILIKEMHRCEKNCKKVVKRKKKPLVK